MFFKAVAVLSVLLRLTIIPDLGYLFHRVHHYQLEDSVELISSMGIFCHFSPSTTRCLR